MNDGEIRRLMRTMFDAAVAAAQPALCLPGHLPKRPVGRLVAIGAGKASTAMARAVEDHWQGDLSGLVVTRYGACSVRRSKSSRPGTRFPMRQARELRHTCSS